VEGWAVYWLTGVCVHDACKHASMVEVNHGANCPWQEFDFDPDHYRVTVHPPALPKYARDGVPYQLAEELTEALRCYESQFYIAAALVGRRVLQGAVRSQLTANSLKARSGNLGDEIQALPDRVLSPQWKEAADHVRYIGNDAAHAELITQEEARSLIDFTMGVFTQMFELAHRLSKATAARQQKKAATT